MIWQLFVWVCKVVILVSLSVWILLSSHACHDVSGVQSGVFEALGGSWWS